MLQFKLKKTEKSLNDTQSDLGEAESKLKSLSGGSNALDSINKVGHITFVGSYPVERFSSLFYEEYTLHLNDFVSLSGASIGEGFGGEEHANCQAGC